MKRSRTEIEQSQGPTSDPTRTDWSQGELAKFIPTEAEIKEACDRIRADWSSSQHEMRFMYRAVPWSVPTFQLSPDGDNSDFAS